MLPNPCVKSIAPSVLWLLLIGQLCAMYVVVAQLPLRNGPMRSLQPPPNMLEKNTPERLRKASDILKYLNDTEDPCNDFYNFACGNWVRYQDVPGIKEGDVVSEAGLLEARVNKKIQQLLASPTSQRDVTKPAKDFFRLCTQAPPSSPAQRQFAYDFVRRNGGMPDLRNSNWQPNYNWLASIGNMKRLYNLDILITLSIQNSRGTKVYLDEPQTTILPPQYCSAMATTQQIEERDQALQQEIKDNLRNWLDLGETDASRVAGDILSFEYQLCRYMRKDQMVSLPSDNDAMLRKQQLSAHYRVNNLQGSMRYVNDVPEPLQKLLPEYRLDLKQFVDQSLGNYLTTEVVMRSKEYFAFLGTVANKGLQGSFANYIMYRALSDISFPSNLRDPASFCAQKAMKYFPEMVGSLYSNAFSERQNLRRENARDDVRELFSEIKAAFRTYIEGGFPWMQPNVKRTIQAKLAQLELREPQYMDNNNPPPELQFLSSGTYWQALNTALRYSANRTLYRTSARGGNAVEAFGTVIATTPIDNQLQLPLSLMQMPLYSPNMPKSLKYSGLGFALAQAMAKKFDEQGWHENPMGVANWDETTKAGSQQYRECFRSQLSNYYFNTPETYRNGTQLRDFMADSIGVDVAFLAYLTWLGDTRNEAPWRLETLTDVNYSNTQLFFIHYAQSRCAAKYRDPGTPEFFPMDLRTSERLIINGALGNGYEFGRDFNCAAGTDLNLGDKCLIDSQRDSRNMGGMNMG